MVKRIQPVSRIIKIDAEVRRIRSWQGVKESPGSSWALHWIPRVDIYEKKEEIIVEAEVPGVAETDIEITVQSNRVELKGQKKENLSSSKVRFLRLEREFGPFRRLVVLPGTVVPEKAKAFLSNGVLTLWLKKYLTEEDRDGREK